MLCATTHEPELEITPRSALVSNPYTKTQLRLESIHLEKTSTTSRLLDYLCGLRQFQSEPCVNSVTHHAVCLRGKAEDAGSWRIVLGKHRLKRSETPERTIPVKRIYRHEHFRYPTHSELDYDIALVKAATDIVPNNHIRYACLPRKQINLKPGQYCWVTGWGDTRGKVG